MYEAGRWRLFTTLRLRLNRFFFEKAVRLRLLMRRAESPITETERAPDEIIRRQIGSEHLKYSEVMSTCGLIWTSHEYSELTTG